MKNKIKKLIKVITTFSIVFVVAFGCITMTACGKDGESVSVSGYELSTEKVDGGYIVRIKKGDVSYSTSKGALGVRFEKNEYRADDAMYSHYSSVENVDGMLVGKGEICSPYGSVIEFTDYYTVGDNDVHFDRRFSVKTVGDDYGFTTEFKITDDKAGRIIDSEWVIPSMYYVTGEHTFDKIAARTYFSGLAMTLPAEDVSALYVSRYNGKNAFTMYDTTAGYRESTISDSKPTETHLIIDENNNMPGIALADEEVGVSFSHLYPTHSNRAQDLYVWRLLPVEQGLTREISCSLEISEEESYEDVLQNTWRKAYDIFEYADKRYDAEDVYNVLLDQIDRSYSDNNIWGGIPQYMTNLDHYFPDSGFLYRNIEFATLMLKQGRKTGDAQMVENAWTVINYQLENDSLDFGMRAYQRDNVVFKRVMYEGLASAVQLYAYEHGVEGADKEFLKELYDYIITKAELYKDDTEAMALIFYAELCRNKDILFVDYFDTFNRLLETYAVATEEYDGYYKSIENSNNIVTVAEDYMILLRAYVDAYEFTGRQKWLDKSVQLANYLETFQIIQPFQLNLIGTKGNEGWNTAFIGNERFLAHGYFFNNNQHAILDTCATSAVIEYYRLYKITGDEHYLDYVESKLYNTLIYVNMGDKVGWMDDPLHSAGLGFMNEFVGNKASNANHADSGIRGAAHDSNLGWNIWQIVYPFDWFLNECGSIIPSEIDTALVQDLAKARVATGGAKDAAHSAYKAVDGQLDNYWMPAGDNSAVVDLYEFCDITAVSVVSEQGSDAYVSFSNDGETFSEETKLTPSNGVLTANLTTVAKYVKVRMSNAVKVSKIEVLGKPTFYQTLSYQADVVSASTNESGVSKCLDMYNYSTSWNAGSATKEVNFVLDLKAEKSIFQTAIKMANTANLSYVIEISLDGETWEKYAEVNDTRFVYVDSGYARARYVKLTLKEYGQAEYKLSDFKVMGC